MRKIFFITEGTHLATKHIFRLRKHIFGDMIIFRHQIVIFGDEKIFPRQMGWGNISSVANVTFLVTKILLPNLWKIMLNLYFFLNVYIIVIGTI